MSIESSLFKLADKIDAQGASDVKPDYKNPNNSIEKSIDRIAENFSSSGGSSDIAIIEYADEDMVYGESEISQFYTTYYATGAVPFILVSPETINTIIAKPSLLYKKDAFNNGGTLQITLEAINGMAMEQEPISSSQIQNVTGSAIYPIHNITIVVTSVYNRTIAFIPNNVEYGVYINEQPPK